jgi:polyphosphate kinase 2
VPHKPNEKDKGNEAEGDKSKRKDGRHHLAWPTLSNAEYKEALYEVQVELVKLQRRLISEGDKIVVILEGRDAAGKDGLIKRLTQHMAPRETRIVALGKPSDREEHSWYFQRYTEYLPTAGEFVVFNRSWYNRAGVEVVMGFCTDKEHERFMRSVGTYETMLVQSGITLIKYYLDIGKDTQKERLADRMKDPLTQWKVSPIDRAAQTHWDEYSRARDEMFRRTSHEAAPWTIVRADHKKTARIALIRDLLDRLEYPEKVPKAAVPDRRVVFRYSDEAMREGMVWP